MSAASVYRELVAYLAEHSTPELIRDFRVSATAQARADELIERSKAGNMTADEADELRAIIEFDEFVGVLKVRALQTLA